MTYLALDAVFLLAVAGVVLAAVLRSRAGGIRWRALVIAAAALLMLTAVFDNVMIAVGLVGYDADRISGIRVGVAPIEDFAYAIAAALLLPALWHIAGRRRDREAQNPGAQNPDARNPDA